MADSLETPPHPSPPADARHCAVDDSDQAARDSGASPALAREPPPVIGRPTRLPQIQVDDLPPAAWRRWWSRVGRWQSSGCVVSFLFHLALLLLLGLLVDVSLSGAIGRGLTARISQSEPSEPALDVSDLDTVLLTERDVGVEAVPIGSTNELPQPAGLLDRSERSTNSANLSPAPLGFRPAEPADWLLMSDTPVDGALDGRSRRRGAALDGDDGATRESERAVEWGLRWLRAHQRDDGSWNFDHNKSVCRGQCRNPGTEASTTAATAIVLLPFLGAGYTHVEGEYRDVVGRGIYYLMKRAHQTSHGIDLQEGTMYAQGLSTIALCEAYAMTRDPALRDLAQGAIDFVVYAQDVKGGGWRYMPGQPGDTTVTGWQLMGLKSGQMGRLDVPSPSLYLARRFLDGVQSEDGARYGYLDPQPRNTTTAIGLLCRMYTGWRRDHPGLQKGVAYLGQWGPSPDNMYFNYYATQVLHHWGGTDWRQWNRPMRDYLVATQATTSHEAGSWYFSGGHGDVGGRLYNTAMAVMTLEVYYRYMPIYREEAVADEF